MFLQHTIGLEVTYRQSSRQQMLPACGKAWAFCQIYKGAGCACTGNAGKVFPRHRLQRKPLVCDPGMHHGTCVTHVPWCMSGSLICGDGENVLGIPGACATRNFTYLIRGPWNFCKQLQATTSTSCTIQTGRLFLGTCCQLSFIPLKMKTPQLRFRQDTWQFHYIIHQMSSVKVNSVCNQTFSGTLGLSEGYMRYNLTIIGSDNGSLPCRHQAIIWNNAGILSIRPLGTNFSKILIHENASEDIVCEEATILSRGGGGGGGMS